MKILNLDLGDKSYPIYIGDGVLDDGVLAGHIFGRQVLVVSDEVVAPIYLERVREMLAEYEVEVVVLKVGEQFKTLETVNLIFDALLQARFERSATLIALGGGVIGDMTGFAAASYLRGVNFIQIPTTLLAQVDSSVGGKTGVNHALGKNMIGAFYQPKCVLADVATLATLDERQYAAGMAEVIKYGLLGNTQFLDYLLANIDDLMARDTDKIIEIVRQSCEDKAAVVADDELEKGSRALLNLGHTFGHAIENTLGYGVYLHGEAVAVGMLMAAELSQLEGYLSSNEVATISTLLQKAHLPTEIDGKISPDDFIKAMAVDKKNLGGKIRLILLKKIGEAIISDDYKAENLQQIITQFCQPTKP